MPKTRDEIAAAYDSPPWWYDIRGFFILTFSYNSTLPEQLRFFGPHFGPQHLEVACGTGTLLELVLRWRQWNNLPEVHIVGIDYADRMLAGAQQRFSGRANIDLRHADAAALPFPDDTFDTVNIANAIHCFPDVQSALRDIFRVMKPGGTMAINVLVVPRGIWPFNRIAERINRWGMRKGILFKSYMQEEIRWCFLGAGFKIRSEDLTGNCCDFVIRKPILPLVAYQRMAQQSTEAFLSRVATARWRRWLALSGILFQLALYRVKVTIGSWIYRDPASLARVKEKEWVALAELLKKKLGALKGLLMKFGQMASYLDDNMALSFRQLLASLQHHSPALDPQKIRAIVEKSLGGSIETHFTEWEDRPLAAASMAQIHLARLVTGEQVVVKVKYPGIEKAIRSDLSFIKLLSSWLGKRLGVANMRALLDELGAMILGECDFLTEAENQELFRTAFSNDSQVVIPRVFVEHSTNEVLTMEYVEGKSFAEFRAGATQEQKNHAAETIARVAAVSIHQYCIYNGDPHPGNYLFLADGRVAFLDFGFTRRWPPELINLHKSQSLAAFQGDFKKFADLTWRLGYQMVSPEGYHKLMEALLAGPFAPWLADKPFRFSHTFLRSEIEEIAGIYRHFRPVKLSRTHLLLQRIMWGQHALFADMDAEFNLHRIVLPLLQQPVPEGKPHE